MVTSALKNIQPETSKLSNNVTVTGKTNADTNSHFENLDCKVSILSAVEASAGSNVSPGSDYREVKTEATELYNDVDIVSDNGLVLPDSLFGTVAEESAPETGPKEKRSLDHDAKNVSKSVIKAKGKVQGVQQKRKASQSKMLKSSVKLKSKIKSENENIRKNPLNARKQPHYSVEDSSEMKIKEERPDDSDTDNTVEHDLSYTTPKLSQEVTQKHEGDGELSLDSVERTEEKYFKCSHCNRLFSRIYHCDRHLQVHAKKGVDANKLKAIDIRVGRYNCHLCGEPFAKDFKLSAHLKREHPEYKPYACQLCNFSFNRREKLTEHQHTHTKPYCCEKCGQRFGQKVSLRAHMFEHTDSELVCDHCNKCFKAPSALKRHVQLAHLAKGLPVIKNHICETCGKSFKWRRDFFLHKLVHTGEKPHSCETCGKCFARKDALALHKQRHNDVKVYNCSLCPKSFTTKTYLVRHKRTHRAERKLYPCEHCHRLFTRSDNLRTHLRLHSGDKPHTCQICGKSYTQAISLNQHMNSHRNDFSDIGALQLGCQPDTSFEKSQRK